jgi:hypothetical protein
MAPILTIYRAIAPIVAPILLVILIVQSIRADGFLWFDGLSDKLAACESVNARANEASRIAADKARDEGRTAAEAAALDLLQKEQDRRKATDQTIADLRVQISKLRPISPPPIVLPGQPEPPIVITPLALPRECRLDQSALDVIRSMLNNQRGVR